MKQIIRLIKIYRKYGFPSLKDFNDYIDEIIAEDFSNGGY